MSQGYNLNEMGGKARNGMNYAGGQFRQLGSWSQGSDMTDGKWECESNIVRQSLPLAP